MDRTDRCFILLTQKAPRFLLLDVVNNLFGLRSDRIFSAKWKSTRGGSADPHKQVLLETLPIYELGCASKQN